MKKSVLLIFTLITIVLLNSCASRKVNISNTDIKKDSMVNTKVNVATKEIEKKSDSTNVSITSDDCELVIKPIDSTKDIVVKGVHYNNVTISLKKNKTKTTYSNNKKQYIIKSKDSIVDVTVHKTVVVKTKTKETKKQTNYFGIISIFIIIILILNLIWRNRIWLLKKLR